MSARNFHLQSKFPCAFECTGELLFGQMQCILEGLNNESHDGSSGTSQRPKGGTILQNDFQYCVAAKVGQWNVSRIFFGEEDSSAPDGYVQTDQIGYVLHHEDVSAIEYVNRALKVGISNGNRHKDKGIVYINRYDWSWHHGSEESIDRALAPVRHTDEQISDLMGGHMFVIDPTKAHPFLQALSRFYPKRKCYLLNDSPNNAPYGIHLDSADGETEYELGWLGFSGDKHELFPESDELVAMIYDPSYHGLEVENTSQVIMVEDMVVRIGGQ